MTNTTEVFSNQRLMPESEVQIQRNGGGLEARLALVSSMGQQFWGRLQEKRVCKHTADCISTTMCAHTWVV